MNCIHMKMFKAAKEKRAAVNVLSDIEYRLRELEKTAQNFNELIFRWRGTGILEKTFSALSPAEHEGIRTRFEDVLSQMERIQRNLLL